MVEITFPYFHDIWRMHRFAQPFAVLCNMVFGLAALIVAVVIYAAFVLMGVVFALAAFPVVVATELWNLLSNLRS